MTAAPLRVLGIESSCDETGIALVELPDGVGGDRPAVGVRDQDDRLPVERRVLGQELMQARTNLPDFNQDGGILNAVATFHPRTLLARPTLKVR